MPQWPNPHLPHQVEGIVLDTAIQLFCALQFPSALDLAGLLNILPERQLRNYT